MTARMMMDFGNFYAGRRVLVTGHTGFKGSWLLHWLDMPGAEVTGLSVDIPSSPSHFELTGLGSAATTPFRDIRDRAALADGRPIVLRSPAATRPWQHVLEPLGGYLLLAAQMRWALAGSEAAA